MREVARPNSDLFENGPPLKLQRLLGLVTGEDLKALNVGRRAVLVLLIGWAPLVLLTVAQSLSSRAEVGTSLLLEVGVHARYLLAAPLLVLAEGLCTSQLSAIVRHFVDSGIVPGRELGRFDAAVASTRRLLDSNIAEVAVVALAYLVMAAAVYSHPMDQIPVWHKAGADAAGFSLAGWWHILVSMPVLLVLLFWWVWRIALWTRLLWIIARLDLRLLASHPDRAAGLGFVGYSLRAFSIVALALATIAAGRSAHTVLVGGGLPTRHLVFNIGLLLTVVALFVAPLLVFVPTLMKAWRVGAAEYGTLADRVGGAFEDKWLGRDGRVIKPALDTPDFSVTIDLYSVVANVRALRFIPVDGRSLIILGCAMLPPFIPVVLLAVPLEVIWSKVTELLF